MSQPSELSNLKDAVSTLVRERLDTLSAKAFDELEKLASQTSEDLNLLGKKVILSVWHDTLASQEHRVVVQAYIPGLLGVGRMHADGFVVNDKGEQRTLTREEWAPFS